ncbi:MAG: hypothetical protein ACI8P9_002857 [Parasphingorhabdus sp.]
MLAGMNCLKSRPVNQPNLSQRLFPGLVEHSNDKQIPASQDYASRLKTCFDARAFKLWLDQKLNSNAGAMNKQAVELKNLACVSEVEHQLMLENLNRHNFSLYRCEGQISPSQVARLGRQFSLQNAEQNLCADESSISTISVSNNAEKSRYIPYTDRALGWHTDGYYNPIGKTINAFILHCSNNSVSGGENKLLDHELIFGWLVEKFSCDAFELFAPDVMTVPANRSEDVELRAETSCPMFYFNQSGGLQMRYSARQRNIEWKSTQFIRQALAEIADRCKDLSSVNSVKLVKGMGILSRNALHCRTAFNDIPTNPRLLYRVRYYDHIPYSLENTFHAVA